MRRTDRDGGGDHGHWPPTGGIMVLAKKWYLLLI